jgi:hypothetical protein
MGVLFRLIKALFSIKDVGWNEKLNELVLFRIEKHNKKEWKVIYESVMQGT